MSNLVGAVVTMESAKAKRFVLPAIIAAQLLVLGLIAYVANGAPVSGVMVRSDQVAIEVKDQKIFDAIAVDRVKIPTDGWVVARAVRDGKAAEVIGFTAVKAGETSPVMIDINQQRGVPRTAQIVLYADRNTRGAFEFTGPMLVTDSSGGMSMAMGDAVKVEEVGTAEAEAAGGMAALEDKPLYAQRQLVAQPVKLMKFNVGVRPDEAVLENAYVDATGSQLTIGRVKAPGPSWIVVSKAGTGPGGTGQVLTRVPFQPGEMSNVVVKLKTPMGSEPLVVSLHADLGQRGKFEFDPRPDKNDKVTVVDQLYFLDLTMISLGVAPAPLQPSVPATTMP